MFFTPHNVLLVDDDAGDQHLMRQALRAVRSSIDLHVVDTLSGARDFLSKHGKYAAAPDPACVVLDLHLPDGHGEGLLDWMSNQARLKAVPVITLSGQSVLSSWPNVVGRLTKPSGLSGYDRLATALSGLIVAAVDAPLHTNDNFSKGALEPGGR